jgi:hypothetical protein
MAQISMDSVMRVQQYANCLSSSSGLVFSQIEYLLARSKLIKWNILFDLDMLDITEFKVRFKFFNNRFTSTSLWIVGQPTEVWSNNEREEEDE